MTKTVRITLYKDLEINVTGKFIKSEKEVGMFNTFDIKDVELIKGSLLDLMNWSACQAKDLFIELEQKVLEKL